MGIRDFLTNVDIFGSPFQFEMGIGNAKRKTSFGGILSIVLVVAAILYFIYLNYQFANGLIAPKITSQEIQFKQNSGYTFDSSLIYFDQQNIEDNSYLKKYLDDQGLSVIKYTAELYQSDSSGNNVVIHNIPLDYCSKILNDDTIDYADAQCLDLSGLSEEDKSFYIYPTNGYDTSLVITLSTVCDPDDQTKYPGCSWDPQDEYVFGEKWTFYLYIEEEQFDAATNSFISKTDENNWDFDYSLTTISTISMQISQTTVKSGFLVGTSQDYYYYSGTSVKDSFKTRGISAKVDPLAVFQFTIRLDSTQFVETIQYAQYPEILAQFGSIVNVLLLVGIIGMIVAKADIQQYFVDQKLKEYYRQTAFKIINSDGKALAEEKDVPLQPKNGKVTKEQVLKVMKEIDSKDMNHELTKKMKISALGNIIKSVKAESKEDYMKKKRGHNDIYETLFFQSTKCQDIFELQSDLMKMKKILAMLITPEQYAAIKCCGSSITDQIPFLLERNTSKKPQIATEKDNKYENEIESQTLLSEKTLNHIELIDKVDYDDAYFEHKLDAFFKKQEKGFSEEDDYNKRMNERLMACLNKTYGDSIQSNIEVQTLEKS